MSDFIEFRSSSSGNFMSIRVSSILSFCSHGDETTCLWLTGISDEFIVGHSYTEVKSAIREHKD